MYVPGSLLYQCKYCPKCISTKSKVTFNLLIHVKRQHADALAALSKMITMLLLNFLKVFIKYLKSYEYIFVFIKKVFIYQILKKYLNGCICIFANTYLYSLTSI